MSQLNSETSESRMNAGAAFVTFVPPIVITILMIAAAHIAPWTPSRIAAGRRLVTHGLYSRIRHPVYVFGWFALAGLVLYLNQPVFLLLLILIVPVQVVRARAEERVLEQRFGEEYAAYRAGTWF